MRVAVTGSNGLLGSRVAARLLSHGDVVLGVSRGPKTTDLQHEYRSVELVDEAATLAALSAFKPEAVIHTAAMTDVDACERDKPKAFAINVTASANVSRAAAAANAQLVHVSTDYVFDGERGDYSEEDAPNPRGAYAMTKLLGEGAARLFSPSCAIARAAVVFGWPQANHPNFGSWVVSSLSEGREVKLFADQRVSPSLADNVADMLIELAKHRLSGVFHTAGADVVDRVTFGLEVCERFGFSKSLVVPSSLAQAKLLSPRPRNSGLSVRKIRAQLQTRPLGVDEAIEKLHEAWQKGRA